MTRMFMCDKCKRYFTDYKMEIHDSWAGFYRTYNLCDTCSQWLAEILGVRK